MSAAGPDTTLFAVLVLPSPSGKNLIFCLQSSAEVCQGVLTLSCRGTGSSEGDGDGGPSAVAPAVIPTATSPRFGAAGHWETLRSAERRQPRRVLLPQAAQGAASPLLPEGHTGGRTCPQCRGPPSGNVSTAFGSRGRARPVGTGAPVNSQAACVRHTSLRRRRIKGFPANPSALHLRSILISKLMQV